jgi:hypothetical protein
MPVATLHSRPGWHSDGLRWIASLLTAASDALDRRRAVTLHTHESWARQRAMEEYLDDVRYRMHAGF